MTSLLRERKALDMVKFEALHGLERFILGRPRIAEFLILMWV